jgi:hypothetical protein
MTNPPSLDEMVAFLCGESPLDGVWFDEPHPTEKGAYWWRKHLRAAIAADGVPGTHKSVTEDGNG